VRFFKREVKMSDIIAKFEPTAKRGRAPIKIEGMI